MRTLTSTWPFRAAWCKAVRPPRSETLTLLSSGMMTSAHLTALLAAATWSGVCQFLSLALTSAECLINTCTASYNKSRVYSGHWQMFSQSLLGGSGGRRRRGRQRMRWLDGITNSMDMGLVNSGSWWWTGRPGVLRFMGSQRVRHDWATELNWTDPHRLARCRKPKLWDEDRESGTDKESLYLLLLGQKCQCRQNSKPNKPSKGFLSKYKVSLGQRDCD